MDQTLDQVIKTRKIRFNGRTMKPQGGQKQQFKRTGGPGFVKNQPQRRQNFMQFRPRGQFVRNFNQRRPQQFGRMNNMMFGGVQKRNQGGQFMMGNRQNFQQRRPFGQQRFMMQRGFFQQRPQFRQNMMQMFQQQPRRMNFQQRNNNFGGQMRFQQQNRPMTAMRQNQPTKLYISNLDFGVTNQDVKELFSEFGPMVRYGVNFSSAGRSVGSAEVFFKNKISAVKAMQKYHGVTLDGRAMKLEIAGNSPGMQQTQQRQQKPMMQQRLPQQMARNNMNKMMKFIPNKVAINAAAKQIVAQAALRRAKKNFGTRKQMGGRVMKSKMMIKKKGEPNAEQLDADLEAYAASKD